jgi:hypothetical protein
MPTIQLNEIESRTLVIIHTFERAFAGAEAMCRKVDSMVAPGWENSVPKYLIYAVVQGRMGVLYLVETPVDRAFYSLEKLGLIEHSPPKFGRLLTGRWTLPDGRTIETRGECGEHHRGGPSWALEVFIDGTRAFGLSGPPDLSFMSFPQYGCYRLKREGLVVVRAQAPTDGEAATPAPTAAMSGEARALGVLTAHPDWSDTKIANAAHINRTTLYTYPRFMQARAIMKANGPTPTDRRRRKTEIARLRRRQPDTLPDT